MHQELVVADILKFKKRSFRKTSLSVLTKTTVVNCSFQIFV